MPQFQFYPAHASSADDGCFVLGRIVGKLKFLAALDSALAQRCGAYGDIVYVYDAPLAVGVAGDNDG